MNSSSKNILYVLPTNSFSTKERTAVKDMTIALENGHKVFLVTNTNTFFSYLATSLGIVCIPITDHFLNRFSNYHKHFPISKILRKKNIDIVHCYDFSLMFSLSYQLRRYNLISLVMTLDHTVDKPLQKFWYRPLISRIDFFILLNKHLRNDLIGNLGIPHKKIEYFGMGIKNQESILQNSIEESFSPYSDFFLTGTYLSPELKDIEQISPIIYALKVINKRRENNVPIKLVLISSVEFKDLPILGEIKNLVASCQLNDDIIFVTTTDVDGIMNKISLWVSNAKDELLEDFAVSALVHEVPILTPRNFCALELLREYEGIGETYKLFDSRELREKWSKILLGHDLYREKVRLFKFFIEKEHDFKVYRQDFLDLYSKMILRRARIYGNN